MKKVHEQVKIKRYAGMDGNFLSYAHYGDPYFDFMYLLTKLISNQLLLYLMLSEVKIEISVVCMR